jgi:hypothetical protein
MLGLCRANERSQDPNRCKPQSNLALIIVAAKTYPQHYSCGENGSHNQTLIESKRDGQHGLFKREPPTQKHYRDERTERYG